MRLERKERLNSIKSKLSAKKSIAREDLPLCKEAIKILTNPSNSVQFLQPLDVLLQNYVAHQRAQDAFRKLVLKLGDHYQGEHLLAS